MVFNRSAARAHEPANHAYSNEAGRRAQVDHELECEPRHSPVWPTSLLIFINRERFLLVLLRATAEDNKTFFMRIHYNILSSNRTEEKRRSGGSETKPEKKFPKPQRVCAVHDYLYFVLLFEKLLTLP